MAGPLVFEPVGVGAAYGRPGDAQSAYLVRAGGHAVCLDMGAGTFNRLAAAVPPHELAAVVVSHMHPDHCADLLALRVWMAWGPGAGHRLRVLGPPGLRDALVRFAGPDGWDGLMFEDLTPGGGRADLGGGMALTYAEVPHQPPTFASRIDAGGRSVCFGADCAPNAALPELAAGCDLLVAEATFGPGPVPEGVPHLAAAQAAAMAEAAGVGRLLLTHVYPEFDLDATLDAARAATAVPVALAVAGEAVTP